MLVQQSEEDGVVVSILSRIPYGNVPIVMGPSFGKFTQRRSTAGSTPSLSSVRGGQRERHLMPEAHLEGGGAIE